MTDLDTSNHGAVTFQEHQDVEILQRASRDIARAFRREGSHFQAQSVFVVTWEDMALASSHTNVISVIIHLTNCSALRQVPASLVNHYEQLLPLSSIVIC